jgi:hypothetical protein
MRALLPSKQDRSGKSDLQGKGTSNMEVVNGCLKFEGNVRSHSDVETTGLAVTNKGRMPYQKTISCEC